MKHVSLFRCGLLLALLTAGGLTVRAQNVGIGTSAPDASAALDIVSTSKGALLPRVASTSSVSSPATGLIVYQTGGTPGYYYNAGTPTAPSWQQLATTVSAAVTAGNGLTKTGAAVALGGALTAATTIAQDGNVFSLTGGNVGIGTTTPAGLLAVQGTAIGSTTIDQQQLAFNASAGGRDNWQSFTAGVTGNLTRLDLQVGSPTNADGASGTLSVYSGAGIAGTLLTSQAIVYNNVYATFQNYPLATPVAVVAGQQYTYRFQTPTVTVAFVYLSQSNPYAGGQDDYSPGTDDYLFKTYVAARTAVPVLTALSGGNVGIGTAAPSQQLEVAGQVFSTTGGFRFPDNTVQTTAAGASSGTTVAAANGLSATSTSGVTTLALGGTGSDLTSAITIAQAGNNFSLTGGKVGIGTSAPLAGLHIDTPEGASATALGLTLSGGSNGNPSLELRGSGKTPYIDFAESSGVDFTTRLISSGGTLNVQRGLGITGPGPVLAVVGQVFSTTGGFRFPDNTVQTTAATGSGSTGTVAAANGLSATTTSGVTTIALGGPGATLTTATTIAQGGYAFSLTGGTVGIGTSAPNASAALDISSEKALLLPRLTNAQMLTLAQVPGMVVYNVEAATFMGYQNARMASLIDQPTSTTAIFLNEQQYGGSVSQSFTAVSTGIDYATVYPLLTSINHVGASAGSTGSLGALFSLYDSSGTLLSSAAGSFLITTNEAPITVNFPAVGLTIGQSYTLTITRLDANTNTFALRYSANNPYNGGSLGTIAGGDLEFQLGASGHGSGWRPLNK